MAHQGVGRGGQKTRERKTSCPTFPVAAPPLAHFGPRGVLRVAGARPRGMCAQRPRTYLVQCPGHGTLCVLRAPGGRSWPRPPPRWLHSRRRLRAAPGGAPCLEARRCGKPIAPVQPRVGGTRLDGFPERGALAPARAASQSLRWAVSAAGAPPPPPAVI